MKAQEILDRDAAQRAGQERMQPVDYWVEPVVAQHGKEFHLHTTYSDGRHTVFDGTRRRTL